MILPRKAISVRQPKAYLSGCLKGDAFMSIGHKNSIRGYIGLRVADQDFAEAFATALNVAYGLNVWPRADERGYALVRTYNGYGRFDELNSLELHCEEAKAAWLRGLFDSEGNVVCVPKPTNGPNSWDRRVAIFSTNHDTLSTALFYLSQLCIESRIISWSSSPGHKGNLPVFALCIKAGKDNFARFAANVGSSIGRKSTALFHLAETYHPDLCQATREMQARGVIKRIARRESGGIY